MTSTPGALFLAHEQQKAEPEPKPQPRTYPLAEIARFDASFWAWAAERFGQTESQQFQ